MTDIQPSRRGSLPAETAASKTGTNTAGGKQNLEETIDACLQALPLSYTAPFEPDLTVTLSHTRNKAGSKWPACIHSTKSLRFRAALAVALSLVMAAVLVVGWPVIQPVVSRCLKQTGISTESTAWASTSGFILEYQIIYRDDDLPFDDNSHPIRVFERAVDEWARQHSECAPPDRPIAQAMSWFPAGKSSRAGFSVKGYNRCDLAVVLLSDDPAILDDLLSVLAPLAGVSRPWLYPEDLFYHQQDQITYLPEYTLRINGTTLSFPQDVNPYFMMTAFWNMSGTDKDEIVYRAFWQISQPSGEPDLPAPYQFGDIVEMKWDDDETFSISTLVQNWDFLSNQVSPSSWRLSMPKDQVKPDFDPMAALIRKYELMQQTIADPTGDYFTIPWYHIDLTLFPAERWIAQGNRKLTDDEISWSQDVFATAEKSFEEWLEQQPELHSEVEEISKVRLYRSATFGEANLVLTFFIRTQDQEILKELSSLLERASGGLQPEVTLIDRKPPQPSKPGTHQELRW